MLTVALPACHIDGIVWLARSQIAHGGKGLHEAPAPTPYGGSVVLLPWGFPKGTSLAQLQLRPFPPLDPGPNWSWFGWGGWGHLSCVINQDFFALFLC